MKYRFIIQNKEQLKQNDLTGWLFNTLSISCNLQQYKSIQSKILLEDVFTDRELIFSILDAIRTQKTLHITYQSFFRNNAISFEATPYCVKNVSSKMVSSCKKVPVMIIQEFMHWTELLI